MTLSELISLISKSPEVITHTIFYFILTAAVFLIFYVIWRSSWLRFKIQQKFPGNKQVVTEIKYSALTALIFMIYGLFTVWATLEGYTAIYRPIDQYGYGYMALSIFLMILAHDTYFYWTHRLLHWKPLYKKVHVIHHLSHNPTPFSAYSFHPVEALIQGGIAPLVVFIIPHNGLAYGIFMLYALFQNVIGHMGFELTPAAWVKTRFVKWHNTAVHHNMHHQYNKCNYGLYFNIWDRLMKTNHPLYEERYRGAVMQRQSSATPMKTKSAANPVVQNSTGSAQ